MHQTTLLKFFKPNIHDDNPQHSVPLPFAKSKESDSSIQDVNVHSNACSIAHGDPVTKESPVSITLSGLFLTTGNVFVPPHCPNAAIVRIRQSHLSKLKAITRTLLPVRYPDSFFDDCVRDNVVNELCRVLLWDSQPVGWIRCRLEPGSETRRKLYIQAIGVLAPYRGSGLASLLLDQVLQPQLLQTYDITNVFAHVWMANDDALDWYHNRGFRRLSLEEHYYRRLQPPGAWILDKELV